MVSLWRDIASDYDNMEHNVDAICGLIKMGLPSDGIHFTDREDKVGTKMA